MAKLLSSALQGVHVISLRPVGEHAPMRRAAAAHGGKVLALSPWRLVSRQDPDSAHALRAALQAMCVVVTSPAAVYAAQRLHPLQALAGQHWCAVGEGTAAALRRAGIAEVHTPERMDSEGLLQLPPLQAVAGLPVGLITAPGGRNQIAPALRQRGAELVRADVYERVPVALSPRALNALAILPPPFWLALSSGEALQQLWQQLPSALRTHLRLARVAAASARLADLAVVLGWPAAHVVQAGSAQPHTLCQAMASTDAAPAPSTLRRQFSG